MSYLKDFTNGLIRENPLLRLMIGLCSALAVSTKFENGIFMGLAATFVLIFSNIFISAIRKVTPDQIRVSVGIEHVDDIREDFDEALRASQG